MPDPMIFFWNLRHLAEGSPADRVEFIKAKMNDRPAALNLFCEVMPNNKDPQSQCFNYRTSTDQQLCYGALIANTRKKTERKECPLRLYEPVISDCYQRGGFTGRNGSHDWKKIVDRGVGYTDAIGVAVYVIHAPATEGSAARAISFLACALNAKHKKKPWILIGDLNVQPDELKWQGRSVDINFDDLIVDPNKPTHKNGKTLDYALTNIIAAKVEVIRTSERFHGSDHYPILLSY